MKKTKRDHWKEAYLKSLRDLNRLYEWEYIPKIEVIGTLKRNMPKKKKK